MSGSGTVVMSSHSIYPPIRKSWLFGEHICPVECAAKFFLFLGISILIMYIPLGRFTHCNPKCTKSKITIWDKSETSAMCCLCDMYLMMTYTGHECVNIIVSAVNYIWKILYTVKMQFYQLLGALDAKDLCRSVCCDEVDLRNCRCSNHKHCKHSRSKH